MTPIERTAGLTGFLSSDPSGFFRHWRCALSYFSVFEELSAA